MKNFQAGPWAQVLRFRVYKVSVGETQPARIKVFNNNRQRFPVRVMIEVADANGNSVPFPNADLPKIQLIDYNNDQPLPSGWTVSSSAGDFTWDESVIPGDEADPTQDELQQVGDGAVGRLLKEEERNQRHITYYVQTSSSSRMHIAVRVQLPGSSEVYATTTSASISDPNGEGDGNGNFNSSVMAVPTPFPVLPASHYGELDSNGNLMAHRVGNSTGDVLAEEHYLFVNLNQRELPLRAVSASQSSAAGFAVYKKGEYSATHKWGLSYYAQPNGTTPVNFPLPPLRWVGEETGSTRYDPMQLFSNSAGTIVHRSNTRVVIGLLIGLFHCRFLKADYGETGDVPATTLHILDEYGNYHSLNLHFGTRAADLKITRA